MKQHLSKILAVTAACLAISVQAQNSINSSTGTSSDQSGQRDYQSGRHFGGASRMGHQEVRTSKLMGAEVKDSQGQSLGTINDVIVNPTSGRIDFAVISLRATPGTGANTSATSSTSTSTTSQSSTIASAGKLVPVPWMLLRSSANAYETSGTTSSTTSTTTSTSTETQPSFTFSGDASKLQSAPSFDQSNWPDITQFSWRQSIYSHFGMTPGAATGGATSPGGTESSTGTSGTTGTSGSSTTPDSSSSSSSSPIPPKQ